MKKTKKNSSNVSATIILIGLVCLLIIIISGIAYYTSSIFNSNSSTNEARDVSLTMNYTDTDSEISIQNTLPISDEVGKALQKDESDGGINGYFDFSVNCTLAGTDVVNYEIYALKTATVEEISEDYVKIYLTDGANEVPYEGYESTVPVYKDLKVASTNPAGKRLYAGEFVESGRENFRLRMWLADTYTINSTVRTFSIKVNVEEEK